MPHFFDAPKERNVALLGALRRDRKVGADQHGKVEVLAKFGAHPVKQQDGVRRSLLDLGRNRLVGSKVEYRSTKRTGAPGPTRHASDADSAPP